VVNPQCKVVNRVTRWLGEQMAVGRISGPLLKSNLLRDGVDLAFETSLLYLDVHHTRVGINTSTPAYDLDVNGYVRTTNLEVTGQLSVSPDLTISGNTIRSSNGNLNLIPAAGGVVYQGTASIGNLNLTGNTISNNSGDAVEIRPAGSGTTQIYSNTKITGNLEVTGTINADGDVTINGNIILANQSGSINFSAGISSDIVPTLDNTYSLGEAGLSWKNLYAYNSYIGNVSITGSTISTIASGTDLTLTGNGSGSVVLGALSINGTTISSSSNNNIVLSPNGTGIVTINSNQSIQIPTGTTGNRPNTPTAGMIRFNSDYGHYEGYNGTVWVVLDGIYDADRNTYITAELTPGANDKTMRFFVNGSQKADLNATRFNFSRLQAGDIDINVDTISTVTSGANLNLTPNGSGAVVIDNINISGNTINNTVSNGATYLTNTGSGYVVISGTYGFVMPVGNNSNQVTVGNPIGLTRYNTDTTRAEIWDGAEWASVAGPGSGISTSDAELLSILNVFSFG